MYLLNNTKLNTLNIPDREKHPQPVIIKVPHLFENDLQIILSKCIQPNVNTFLLLKSL